MLGVNAIFIITSLNVAMFRLSNANLDAAGRKLSLSCVEENIQSNNNFINIGPPGKRGPKGEKGQGLKGNQGLKGEPGDSCSCENLQIYKDQIEKLIRIQRPRDCGEIFWTESESKAVWDIYPLGRLKKAMCNLPGGWTVIQYRFNGSEEFFRGWSDYKIGFGNPQGEHWIGLDVLHELTTNHDYMLRVELEDHGGTQAYAQYTDFVVGPESDNFRLQIGGFSGTAGDSLASHNERGFTTKDRDNDSKSSGNCANDRKGGWWYNNCGWANLNGIYLDTDKDFINSMRWYHWKNRHEALKSTKMMIKRK